MIIQQHDALGDILETGATLLPKRRMCINCINFNILQNIKTRHGY